MHPQAQAGSAPETAAPAVVELRQYTLRPGTREALIALFEEHFIEPQEEQGISVLGHFRDLDDPDRFVWIRGFADMETRREGLAAFYGGDIWKAHRDAANATMLDSDNVLLLRPHLGSPTAPVRARREPAGAAAPGSIVTATVFQFAEPPRASAAALVGSPDRLRASLTAVGTPLLETEPAENTFPGLPVREGEHVLVRLDRHPGDRASEPDGGSGADEVAPGLLSLLACPPQRLRLSPCSRSLIR
jgi:quinol monooxygenase YgiN